MNKFLRNATIRQLLTAIGAVVAVIAVGTAIAIAAQGQGPVPKRESLARAVHQALTAPAVTAVSARISFTNNLIGSSQIQGADPLLSGGSGRVWYSAGNGLRLELQGDNGDANLVVRNGSFWAYDPSSNTVYRGTLPTHSASGAKDRADKHGALPSIAQIQSDINRAMSHLTISGAIPADVAGRAAYSVRVSPKPSGGLLGAAELAWDAIRGVPLRFALYARGDRTPVVSLSVTGISYGKVPGSLFSIAPPSGAKVVNVSLPTGKTGAAEKHAALPRLPFTLRAPATLAGLNRTSITRLGKDGVLILYGHYLGGVVVIEQVAHAGAVQLSAPRTGDQPGLTLPTVQVGGATAQELDTALGTVVRFSRAGVAYTVLGSVTPRVADAAARGL
jgi:outer membrane lipoprotein-sorting protein